MKKLIYSLVILGIVGTATADCDSTPKHFPGKVPPNHYGSGQTDSFRCAIRGSTELSLTQQAGQADLIPEKLSNRFYLMFGGNAGSESVSSVKNKSNEDTVLVAARPSVKSVKVATNNIELGAGYTWSDFAIDVEWLALKSIDYNAAMIGDGINIPFRTKLKGDALIANLAWIFKDLYNFKLYGSLSLGLSSNQTTSAFEGSTASVVKKISPAYGVGIGARFNLVSKLYADLTVRYILLGTAKYTAANGAGRYMVLKAQRSWIGASARLIWLI